MKVRDVLGVRGREPIIVGPETTIRDAARKLAAHRKGLALVCDEGGRLRGVVSVMDINRAVAAHGSKAPELPVSAVMTRSFCACSLEESVEEALRMMGERGIRHLPVLEEERLAGLVNLRDLLEARFREVEIDVEEMRRYMHGLGYR